MSLGFNANLSLLNYYHHPLYSQKYCNLSDYLYGHPTYHIPIISPSQREIFLALEKELNSGFSQIENISEHFRSIGAEIWGVRQLLTWFFLSRVTKPVLKWGPLNFMLGSQTLDSLRQLISTMLKLTEWPRYILSFPSSLAICISLKLHPHLSHPGKFIPKGIRRISIDAVKRCKLYQRMSKMRACSK